MTFEPDSTLWKRTPPAPQAFPYQGSKRKLAPQILRFLPPSTTHLIEPFAGSAGLSVAAMNASLRGAQRVQGLQGKHADSKQIIQNNVPFPRLENITLSDTNEPLANLWRSILNDSSALSEEYAELWYAQLSDPRAYFFKVRDTFNRTKNPAHFLYLLFRSAKSTVRYNKAGEYNQSPDNRRRGTHPFTVAKSLGRVSKLMYGTHVYSDSYEQFLNPISQKSTSVVYLDPPYQGTSGGKDLRYASGLSREDLIPVLQKAVDADIAFMLSYDAVTPDAKYGAELPISLGLVRKDLVAGRSTHATLLGRNVETVESLYLSPELVSRLNT